MQPGHIRSSQVIRNTITVICATLMLPGDVALWAQQQQPQQQQQKQQPQQPQPAASADQDAKLSNDQLDSLVAPIALYPDPLLSQTLVASTYPLEIVQLQQFLEQNKGLKDKALTDAVMKKGWDPSVQAMAPFPDVVKQMAQNIAWTDDLGNAFLAQQNDVMDAVQRMRTKAMEKGALKTTEQQKVETKVIENKSVVVIEPPSTEVVYVPSYNPTVIWGAPAYYPYPPVAYPAYPVGAAMLSFGVGVAMGAAWGGGWGWNTGWGGHNDININRNNTFVSNYNRTNPGNRYGGANNQWRHNPAHRGGAPYGNQAVANRYGGSARGNTMAQRQNAARQGQRQMGGNQFRGGNSGLNRGGVGGAVSGAAGNRSPSGGNIGSSGDRIGNRSASSGNIGSRSSGSGGGDRVGNRSVSNGSMGSRNSSAFSGGSGSAARASSARGASSMGRGGGGFRGGGGRRR